MPKKQSKLESLNKKQIEQITRQAEKKRRVPLVKSSQVNMRLTEATLKKARALAKAQGIPYTTFLSRLIREDIERLWQVFEKTG